MTIYSFTYAQGKLASVLKKAKDEGMVFIKRNDGSAFVVRPILQPEQPVCAESDEVGLSTNEIAEIMRHHIGK